MSDTAEHSKTRYWVVGGAFDSTEFDHIAEDAEEQRFGPFERYEDALAEWQTRSWQSVDNCNTRFRIVEEQRADA